MRRNHGLPTVGNGIPTASLAMTHVENTCRIQIDAQAGVLTVLNPSIVTGLARTLTPTRPQ